MKVNDQLFDLINSLTKSEKRTFKIYAKRQQGDSDLKFLQLFDSLDKMKEYDENLILKKNSRIKKAQLSNLKAHLYKQILTSLRLVQINYNKDIEIREQIDYAKILFNKGLYKQSLKLLDRIKAQSEKYNLDLLTLDIIEFEKLIESRYITRSIKERADFLTAQSSYINESIDLRCHLSNLALRLYGLYIKVGYVRNEKDYLMVKQFFHSNLPKVVLNEMGFYQRLYFYQCYVWYYYIIQDFTQCYRSAQKWVDLFEEYPEMKKEESGGYMKGLHNLLAALFNILHYDKFKHYTGVLDSFIDNNEKQFSDNFKIQAMIYSETNRINLYFIEGRFSEGIKDVPDILLRIEEHKDKIDQHRIITLYYKIACLYFGAEEYKRSIKYLNEIINLKVGPLREDIHCFARILSLIAHFELKNDDLLEYQIKSVYRFLLKMEDMHLVQKEIFMFLRKSMNVKRSNLKPYFQDLLEKLKVIKKDPYEKRPFLYLDIISWLESKIHDIPVQKVIRDKFLKR